MNLTIAVDEEVLKRARIRALEQGTSVNAVLAERLKAFADEGAPHAQTTQSLVELAAQNSRRGGKLRADKRGGRKWTRDELHER